MDKIKSKSNLFITMWREHRPMIYILAMAIILCLFVATLVTTHFQFGIDIPLLAISNSNTAEHWGQIGDFVGGILNPALSFTAFLTLLYTLKIQSDELKEAREESKAAREDAKSSHKIQEYQTKIFERQSFESAFFGLLNAHLKITENINYLDSDNNLHTGREALAQIAKDHIPFNQLSRGDFPERETTAFRARARSLIGKHQLEIGHYFRSLYQILKYIDSYGKSSLSPGKAKTLRELREQLARDRRNYLEQRQYANMLRAQFSSAEIDLIFVNCLTPQGKDLKYYAEKYSFLKTFNKKRLKSYPKILSLYSDTAYKDSQEITPEELLNIIRTKPQYKNQKTMMDPHDELDPDYEWI
ncbi:putative phage abortive infection protein [Stutzerimonas balearica]|uniref:putative phage abortive infection protein n=1 Tax=Stutzerimonas balearica TaxID=74829 RepID=UPI0037870211